MNKYLDYVSAHHAPVALVLTAIMGVVYAVYPAGVLPVAVALFYLGQGFKDEVARLKAVGAGASEKELLKEGLLGNFNTRKNIFDWVTPTVVSALCVVGVSYAV